VGSTSIVIVAGTEAVPPRLVTVMVTQALLKFSEATRIGVARSGGGTIEVPLIAKAAADAGNDAAKEKTPASATTAIRARRRRPPLDGGRTGARHR
jgi:hypothetical protein